MPRTFVELPTVTNDGTLYYDRTLDRVEALIPNAPYRSCHAADLLEIAAHETEGRLRGDRFDRAGAEDVMLAE